MVAGRLRIYQYASRTARVPIGFTDYDTPDADPDSGRSYVVFSDPVGMPLCIEDDQGNVAWWAERIDPYGAIKVAPNATVEYNLRWPGHYFDPETGLHYNRFRYYDPALARYIQSDPIGYGGSPVNLYSYCANPLVNVDLLGLNGGGGCDSDNRDSSAKDKDGQEQKPKTGDEEKAKRDAEVQKSMQELAAEGHGPQRHGPEITEAQLTARAVEKKDPMTGSTVDGVHGGDHKCGKNATKVNSAEDYVHADEHLRSSSDFENARATAEANGEDSFCCRAPAKRSLRGRLSR